MKTKTASLEQTLVSLNPGERGFIRRVGGEKGATRRRLIDMGLTPGTEITVKKIAPFGDPMEVHLRGYSLSLRKADAGQITLCATREEAMSRVAAPRRAECDIRLRRMQDSHIHERDVHRAERDYADHDERNLKIALVGNPNSGKTTLFNALTGLNQSVGNWPGVTVEKKEGVVHFDGKRAIIVDLPGIYSLSPYSAEELIARAFIIDEKPDAIINIVDATNLERNLYLTVQLLELERPTVIALNFMDEIEQSGAKMDCEALSRRLGVPVVPISARDGVNVGSILSAAHAQMHAETMEPDDLYDEITHEVHHRVGDLVHDRAYEEGLPAHWVAVKLLEGDPILEEQFLRNGELGEALSKIISEYESAHAFGDRETLVADSRYRFIEAAARASIQRKGEKSAAEFSQKIDRIVTNRVLALPIFLLLMFGVFMVTFGPLTAYVSDGIEILLGDVLSDGAEALLASIGTAPWVIRLLTDGVIAGVGGVLTFLPQIAVLFFFLSLLEDSGYMARAAFIMDRLLRRFGLSGKAFIPMLMGYGCTVPAVMGARTMEHEEERRMTIMLVPFMSCSARLPVYALLCGAFFGASGGLVVFSLYLLGILVAVLSGIILKKTAFRTAAAPFVMELPPYRLPSFGNTMRQVWDKLRGFLLRAGTLILAMSIVLWFLQSFNFQFQMVEEGEASILGALGNLIAPIFRPLGFGSWQAAVALLTGLIAKEAVVSSMSLFYGFSLGDSGAAVAQALSVSFGGLSAYSFLVFVLLYVPCIAAMSTIYREMNSKKWAAIAFLWQMGAAYLISMLVYQVGRLFFAG